jgi:hypothetical protein
MSALRNLSAAAAALAASLLVSQMASAAVVGVAVDEVGAGATPIAGAVFAPGAGPDGGNDLGAPAIGYYIPLGNASGVFGVGGFGQSSDFGNGGGTLTMILQFSGVEAGLDGSLNVLFEDLDLSGANDPVGFLESIQIFDAANNPLTGVITAIGGLVTGGMDTQQLLSLSLASSLFAGTDLFLQFNFASSFTSNGTNTAEYLIATVEQVPLPAALPMFLAGLAGLGFARGRRSVIGRSL